MTTTTATAADIRRANGALDEATNAIREAEDAIGQAYRAVKALAQHDGADFAGLVEKLHSLRAAADHIKKAEFAIPNYVH
jgi:hypothetical protein